MRRILSARLGKTIITLSLSICSYFAPAQQASVLPAGSQYTIAARDLNSRVWKRSVLETNAAGFTRTNVQSYTEVRSGLCHYENGVLVDSTNVIDLVADGAQAVHSQHQVHWNANVRAAGGTVRLTTPSGTVLESQVYGLGYWDPSAGTNILISTLQDSQGIVVDNQAIYTNSFTGGVNADIDYTYSIEGLEQNIVFRAQLPDPASWGLNPQTTIVQVLTQFLNPPDVTKVASGADGAENDQYIGFGDMGIGVGEAFLAETNGAVATAGPVRKYWGPFGGSMFLIEEIPFSALAPLQAALPAHASVLKPSDKVKHTAQIIPPPPKAFPSFRTAKAYSEKSALVMDYNLVNTTNYFVFQGDTTYYISGSVSLSGTNIYEGGAVIKFITNGTISAAGASQLTVATSPYRPVIFTAKDDNTIGQPISGSTGNPFSSFYANPALTLGSGAIEITIEARVIG